jgi:hypothetical protein
MFKFNKSLLLPLFFLSLFSCASRAPQYAENSARNIAAAKSGIEYPALASFDLQDFKGTSYISFMKKNVKPRLDLLTDEGFENIGSEAFVKEQIHLNPKTLTKYKGAKWNRAKKVYEGGLGDEQIRSVYNSLKKIKPRSTVESLSYFDREDKDWPKKNDMALALRDARVNAAPFDLGTLYALTGGLGVKVKIDEDNYNYHVLYKTGKTNPHQEVMSGRSFASSPEHGAADATDPEYLKDLQKYLSTTSDVKPFYRALVSALADCDTSGWESLNDLGQSVLSDFLTVYTAEADRHLMVKLKTGSHPWEIDLAAVTFVSAISEKTGKVVNNFGELVESDLGGWFAPSEHNIEGGPQRSGIGITRPGRKVLQKAIHKFELTTLDGKAIIEEIQKIVVSKKNNDDVIQAVFEFLSSNETPEKMGANASKLADLMAQFIELARDDSEQIIGASFN